MSENSEFKTPFFKNSKGHLQGIKDFFSDAGVFIKEIKVRWKQESSAFFKTLGRIFATMITIGGVPIAIDLFIGQYNGVAPAAQIHIPEAWHTWIGTVCSVLASVGAGGLFVVKLTMKGTPVNEAVKENDPEPPITPVLPFTVKKEAESQTEATK